MAVCSTPSSPLSVALPDDAATLLKFLLTVRTVKERDSVSTRGSHFSQDPLVPPVSVGVPLVIQCSAGSSRFFRRPCRTERTEGLWTSCSTNKCDCGGKKHNGHFQNYHESS